MMVSAIENGRRKYTQSELTVGICASDFAPNLPEILEVILTERLPMGVHLRRIVLVASGCTGWVMDYVRRLSRNDSRILLMEEPERKGKAEAINRIISNSVGDYLLLINSDALPARGSISKLLRMMDEDFDIGVVSACPVLEHDVKSNSTTFRTEELMWNVHNESSLLLNHLHVSNHSSDEMMLVRSDAIQELPEGLVNDGAYIAGVAKLKGYAIRFCENAKVKIEVPSRLVDLIQQRRRIIWGHVQVRRLTGKSPKTVRSLLFSNPLLCLRIAIRTVRKSPNQLLALPVAISCEVVSTFLASIDLLTGKNHAVWKRYGN